MTIEITDANGKTLSFALPLIVQEGAQPPAPGTSMDELRRQGEEHWPGHWMIHPCSGGPGGLAVHHADFHRQVPARAARALREVPDA